MSFALLEPHPTTGCRRASRCRSLCRAASPRRAEAFRRQAPDLRKPARRLADQARSLVVNEGLSYRDAAALLLETTWVVLLAEAPPAFDG